jgi:hypothetical protein
LYRRSRADVRGLSAIMNGYKATFLLAGSKDFLNAKDRDFLL